MTLSSFTGSEAFETRTTVRAKSDAFTLSARSL
jgi:hypothetical protein